MQLSFDLQLYDGANNNASKIGRYCGETKPPNATSTLNFMHLIFGSDSSIGGRGFKANYSSIDASCGGIIKKLGVSISPPMEYGVYKDDTICKWIIIAPVGHVVQLSFNSFDLETGFSGCQFDSLSIYDGYINEANLTVLRINEYCGSTLPPLVQSSTNVLSLRFKSDDSLSNGGFVAVYSFIDARNSMFLFLIILLKLFIHKLSLFSINFRKFCIFESVWR